MAAEVGVQGASLARLGPRLPEPILGAARGVRWPQEGPCVTRAPTCCPQCSSWGPSSTHTLSSLALPARWAEDRPLLLTPPSAEFPALISLSVRLASLWAEAACRGTQGWGSGTPCSHSPQSLARHPCPADRLLVPTLALLLGPGFVCQEGQACRPHGRGPLLSFCGTEFPHTQREAQD